MPEQVRRAIEDLRELPRRLAEAVRGLHERWTALLDRLDPEQLDRALEHSELGPLTVSQLTCLYGWHSRHHVAHVTSLRAREGW